MMSVNVSQDYSRVLAIDFGEKRIGTALCDPLKIFSYPFKTLVNDNSVIDEIKKIIIEKEISLIVLGIPSDVDNPNSIRNNILKFKAKIQNTFKLAVILWDESFTSYIAQEKVLQSVSKKSKRRDKGLVDNNSAAIILQEYLNSVKK